jgi:hypothetical protein
MPPEENLLFQGLSQGHPMKFRSLGKSMMPTILPGDMVTIVPHGSPRLGDIVLMSQGEGMVLHRIMAQCSGRIFTKGDATARFDAPIDGNLLRGKAILVQRHGKAHVLDYPWSRLGGWVLSLAIVPLRLLLNSLIFLRAWLLGVSQPTAGSQ